MGAGLADPFAGVGLSNSPLEGAYVLAAKLGQSSVSGVIIAVIPFISSESGEISAPAIPKMGLENGVGLDDVATEGYIADPDTVKIPAASGRPIDALPGEWHATSADYGGRISQAGPVSEIKASELACVRASAIDDSVQIKADLLQEFKATGDSMAFDDGGFTSQEEEVCLYKHERKGQALLNVSSFVASTANMLKGMKTSLQRVYSDSFARSRLRIFKGYLGDIFHAFVCIPGEARRSDANSTAGVFSTHVGADGRLTIKTAAGLSIQRNDAIPVPKRKRFPWDPKGDKAHEKDMVSARPGPYQYKGDSTKSLELRNAEAWRSSRAYENFVRCFPEDFTVDPEGTTPAPTDKYDETAKRYAEFVKFMRKFAAFNIEEDGTVIIQGGEGCEFILGKGKITMHAPNGIFGASGKDIVMLAGNDMVLKAKSSVDVVATKKDVRIKAENNLHMLAANESRGNVLLESKGKGDVTSTTDKGVDYAGKGIVLQCAEGGVAVVAKDLSAKISNNVAVNAEKRLSLAAGTSLYILGESVAVTDGEAGLDIGSGSLRIGGKSIACMAGNSFTASQHTSRLKMEWLSVPGGAAAPYSGYAASIAPIFKLWSDPVSVLAGLKGTPEFTYRTYDPTLAGSVAGPEWHKNAKFYNLTAITSWEENPIQKTYPWPGEAGYVTGNLLNIEGDSNILADAWDKVTAADGELKTPKKFNEYPTLV